MTSHDQDADFARWSREWQAATPRQGASAEEIRRYVHRRGWLMKSFFVADIVIVAIALPVVAYFAWQANSGIERAAMISLAIVTIAAACFGWWNWRGVWRSTAAATTEFIAIAAARSQRMRVAIRAAWILFGVEMAIFTVWVWARLYGGGRRPEPAEERFAWLWLAGFAIAFALSLARFSRWLRRDSAKFAALRMELESSVDQDQ
jgi:hypothetical protein